MIYNFFCCCKNKKKQSFKNQLDTYTLNANTLIDILTERNLQLERENKIKVSEHIKLMIYELYSNSTMTFECPICLDDIKKNDLYITSCGHCFHFNCVNQLKKCPNCDSNAINDSNTYPLQEISL